MHLYPFPALFVGGEIIDLVRETGPVAQFVLLVLLAFSLISWAIILSRWSMLKRARVQSGRFLRAFRRAQRLQDISRVSEQFRPSPLVGVFSPASRSSSGRSERRRIKKPTRSAAGNADCCLGGDDALRAKLPWLAITAAVTPFVGLFGTVWGIIDAFHGLGTSGAATLRAVAPGISEALITTAAGLAAAIPAVIAYNLIGGSLRDFAARCDDFSLEMANAVERQPAAARVPEEARR